MSSRRMVAPAKYNDSAKFHNSATHNISQMYRLMDMASLQSSVWYTMQQESLIFMQNYNRECQCESH